MAKGKRRRSTTSTKRRGSRRRRRSNPGLPGLGKISHVVKDVMPMGIGALAAAIVAKRLGTFGSPIGEQSDLAGAPWTPAQYAGVILGGIFGAKFVGRFGINSEKFMMGAIGLAVVKGVFTVLAPKIPGAATLLGDSEEIEYDPVSGQAWYMENGKKVALQGLVTASPMDGYNFNNYGMAGLVTASPMDGEDDNLGDDDMNVLQAY